MFLANHEENIELKTGKLGNSISNNISDKNIRNNKMGWIFDTNWFSSVLYYYVEKANRENFLYDINGFEDNVLQYSKYGVGEHYTWHSDENIERQQNIIPEITDADRMHNFSNISSESVRKLSVSLQLSDPSEYEGGELQIMDSLGKLYTCPKEMGTIIIFDSRARHRVRKVKSGVRKSLVGWVMGPRWK